MLKIHQCVRSALGHVGNSFGAVERDSNSETATTPLIDSFSLLRLLA